MEYGRLTRYDITIESTQNKRLIARVGCGAFAFTGGSELLDFLKNYFNDPQSIREKCSDISIAEQPNPNRV